MAHISRRHPMLRRSQAMWVSRRAWQPRIVFWAGAISVGLISVLFAVLADGAQALCHIAIGHQGGWRWQLFTGRAGQGDRGRAFRYRCRPNPDLTVLC